MNKLIRKARNLKWTCGGNGESNTYFAHLKCINFSVTAIHKIREYEWEALQFRGKMALAFSQGNNRSVIFKLTINFVLCDLSNWHFYTLLALGWALSSDTWAYKRHAVSEHPSRFVVEWWRGLENTFHTSTIVLLSSEL